VATAPQPDFRRNELLTRDERAAWVGLLQTSASLVRRLDDELRQAHGLPLSSFELLAQLYRAPDYRLRMAELAEHLVLTRSGVTRLVDRLVRGGLVRRLDADCDGRGVYAELTRRGFEAFDEAAATHVDGLRRLFFGRLGVGELERLNDLWDRTDLDPARAREQRLREARES
jgi:DNA-binding MarR family transcriptional regulator